MRAADIYVGDQRAGKLWEDESGYHFQYLPEYLNGQHPMPVSLTLPLQQEVYSSTILFPFFDGLIPEGFLQELALTKWDLKRNDRMGLLLSTGADCIGNVHLIPQPHE